MKIAYLTYWSISEGLSQATSIQHLRILNNFSQVDHIDYYTFEKSDKIDHYTIASKINHHILKRSKGSSLFDKIKEYLNAWKKINKNNKINKYDLVIARSSFAGIFAFFLRLIYGIPFVVESFEPHSEYQVHIPNGWSKWGPRYLFLNLFERIQKKYASLLLPVSYSYKKKLIEQGVCEGKIIVQPCCVDYFSYEFCSFTRQNTRNKLNIPNDNLVGVYAGKFGGLYYDKEAFKLIGELNKALKNKFSLILLTPKDYIYIKNELLINGLELKNINILFVKPDKVFQYLFAADFAFNFHISNDVSNCFSPIKNAEYWSAGLPIIIPNNIGDDSKIVDKYDLGVVHDFSNNLGKKKIDQLFDIVNIPDIKLNIRKKTMQFRSMDLIKSSYSEMFKCLYIN